MLTEQQKDQLAQPLDPSLVKQRDDYQGGRKIKLSYIEGHTAKRHANEIFGFDGWSYEVVHLQDAYHGDHIDRKTGEVKGRKCAYVAQVRVGSQELYARMPALALVMVQTMATRPRGRSRKPSRTRSSGH